MSLQEAADYLHYSGRDLRKLAKENMDILV